MRFSGAGGDKRLLLWMGGGVAALILLVSIMTPKTAEQDPTPSITNASSAGAKAAFLLLPQLGYTVQRWDAPEAELDHVDAERTTLVMANPYVSPKEFEATKAAVQRFVQRGGRVLATGTAALLPEGQTGSAGTFQGGLCETVPEGQGALAKVGSASMNNKGGWVEKESKLGSALHVAQRCGNDAVVVSYAFGKGTVVWWSSAMPLSNGGLHDDASLKLLLASVGEPGRTVLFDEGLRGKPVGMWDAAKGLPLRSLVGQFALIAVLLILSFSRRNGPLRMPVTVPRTSPAEFAESMGHLYERASATNAATGMARRRVLRFLQNECGVARVTIDEGPAAIAEALRGRFGGDWSAVQKHLGDAAEAEHAELTAKSALRLVQALDEDVERLEKILAPARAAKHAAARETILKEDTQEQRAELVSAAKE